MKDSKIVILGGGPVGLIFSYMLHARGFKHITIIEKRCEYTRHQIVSIPYKIYSNSKIMPPSIGKYLVKHGCFVDSPQLSSKAICYINKSPFIKGEGRDYNITIPLFMLEEQLYKYINKHVTIIRPKPPGHCDVILDTQNKQVIIDNTKHVPYDILVGADGVNGLVKSTIFKKYVKYFDLPVSYAIILQFCCENPTISDAYIDLNNASVNFTGKYRWWKSSKEFGLQNRVRVLRSRDGYFTIAIQLTKEEYQTIRLPSSLTNNVENFKKFSPKKFKMIIEDLFEIYGFDGNPQDKLKKQSTLVIKPNMVTTPYIRYKDADYYLIGDSLINTHFFSGSGLTNGIWTAWFLTVAFIMNDNNELIKMNQEYINSTKLYIKYALLKHKEVMKSCRKSKTKASIKMKNKHIKPFRIEEENCYYTNHSVYKN